MWGFMWRNLFRKQTYVKKVLHLERQPCILDVAASKFGCSAANLLRKREHNIRIRCCDILVKYGTV